MPRHKSQNLILIGSSALGKFNLTLPPRVLPIRTKHVHLKRSYFRFGAGPGRLVSRRQTVTVDANLIA